MFWLRKRKCYENFESKFSGVGWGGARFPSFSFKSVPMPENCPTVSRWSSDGSKFSNHADNSDYTRVHLPGKHQQDLSQRVDVPSYRCALMLFCFHRLSTGTFRKLLKARALHGQSQQTCVETQVPHQWRNQLQQFGGRVPESKAWSALLHHWYLSTMEAFLFTNERLQLPANDTSIIWEREEEEEKGSYKWQFTHLH